MNQIEEFVREVEKELELKLKEFNNSLNSLFEKMERELDELNRKFKSLPRKRGSLIIALRELRSLKRKAYAEVKNAMNVGKAEFRNLIWNIKRKTYDLGKNLNQESREELLRRVDELLDEYSDKFDELVDEWSDRLDYFIDMLSDLSENVKLYLEREPKFFSLITAPTTGFRAVNETFKALNDFMKRFEESLNKLFGEEYRRGAWGTEPTLVVSSIRLPKSDLELIDLLVEVGVFKSRSEGVSFFTHKGIEASKEALEKLRSKLEEIRKLQEEVKKEAEHVLKGERRETKPNEENRP